jgi:GTPase SAR1 family protein
MILLALQDEIKTLIEKQQKLMGKLRDEKAIWGREVKNTSLAPSELERQISALASDSVKVQALESTIAVIGTMKAGKSTTINALIGEEVLPHRLTAMTTLPTLIRHKPGQKEPVLKLHKIEIFKALVDEVKAIADRVDETGYDLSKIQEALETVSAQSDEIKQGYVGKKEIHEALFLINDTFRLAGHEKFNIDLKKYLEHFTDISSLPTVEVEFRCLAGKPEGAHSGSLALLDTPGPNEAGQSKVLKDILSKQIEKNASMVLLVMNYTQLNTEQDSEIRSQIRGIKGVFKDRSFIVVNRFDEKKQNDLNEEQTKKLASDLLNDSIDDDDFITSEQVFPVSSHYAFIVEKVRQQIDAGDDIASFLGNIDNRDFIQAAFGVLDEDEIEDLTYKQVELKCARLFKRSGYEGFTNNMLERAYTKAGENSLQAALARLNENAIKIDRLSTVVTGGLAQEMGALRASIERTKNLSQAINNVYSELDKVKGSGISQYREKARNALQEHVEDIKSTIGREFDKERSILVSKLENEVKEKNNHKDEKRRSSRLSRSDKNEICVIDNDLEYLHAEIKKHSKGSDGILDFGSDHQAALDFSRRADGVVSTLFSSMAGSLQEQLNLLEKNTQDEIQVVLFGQLEKLCNDYQKEMQGNGFEFNVSLSESFSLDVLGGAAFEVDKSGAIEESTESVTRKRKQRVPRDGWLHSTLKVLSLGFRDDYDERVVSKTHEARRYRISLDEYVKNARDQADKFYLDIDSRLESQFEEKLVPAVDDVFSGVIAAVRDIEEALDQSKKLKVENVTSISEVKTMMDGVKKENATQLSRVGVAKRGIDELIFGK